MKNPYYWFTIFILITSCAGLSAQPLSMVFDPPRELVMEGMDTFSTPYVHRTLRNFDLDWDGQSETAIKLCYGLFPGAFGLEWKDRHRISSPNIKFAKGFSFLDQRVEVRDSLGSGLFTIPSETVLDLRWTGPAGKRYMPFAVTSAIAPPRYGWLWVEWLGDRFYVHGWQLSDTTGVAVPMGSFPIVPVDHAAAAFAISASDVAEGGTSADLQVRFRVTPGESGISEYRSMVVPSTLVDFDANDALAVPAGRYLSKLPDGTPAELSYPEAALDVQGNPIVQDQLYRIAILSVQDGILATQPTLVWGSTRQLRGRVEPAETLILQDSLNVLSSEDFFISFNAPSDETHVQGYWCGLEYRPEIYESYSWTFVGVDYLSYEVEDILSMPLDRRFFIPSSGGTYSQQVPSGMKTLEGTAFTDEGVYRLVVVTVPDYIGASSPAIAYSDWTRLSDGFSHAPVSFSYNTDKNHLDGRHISVSFEPAIEESGISEYRLFVIPSGTSVNEAGLLALPDSLFTRLTPTASSYAMDFGGQRDVVGNPILIGGSYSVVWITIGDSVGWFGRQFSKDLGPSPFLTGSVLLCQPDAPNVTVVDSTGTAADLEVFQERPLDSIGLAAVRIVILPVDSVLSAEKMISLAPGNYTDLTSTSFMGTLPSSLRDAYGHPLIAGEFYYMQSQFVPDSVDASVFPVSLPSEVFTLDNTSTQVRNLQFYDGGVRGTAVDLKISFLSALDESTIANYRILIHESLTPLTRADIEGAGPASYVDKPAGEGVYYTNAEGYLTFEGNPVWSDRTYGLVVASLDSAGFVIAKAFTTGQFSDSDIKVETLSFEDRADYGDSRDFHVTFSEPYFSDSISSYSLLISKSTFLFHDSILLATPEEFLHVIPPGFIPPLNYQLPEELKDFTGNEIEPFTNYRIAVISTIVLPDTMRKVVFSSVFRYIRPKEWLVNDFYAYPLSSSVLRVQFKAAEIEDYLSDYRLIIVPSDETLTLEEALAVPSGRRHDFATAGASSYSATFPGTLFTKDGMPVNDGLPKKAYILSYADPEHGTLVEAEELFTLFPPTGIVAETEESIQLYTTSSGWILKSAIPIAEIRLSDALGRMMLVDQPNSNQVEVAFTSLPAGLFIIQVRMGTRWSSIRVMRP